MGAVDAVTDGDDGIEVVEVDLPAYGAITLFLNSPNFSESCFCTQFARCVNLAEMVTYGSYIDGEEFGDSFLVEPECFTFVEDSIRSAPTGVW